ncbi:MAG TPA: efflux RND transporter periplasmic adaptor subunit [Opitutaceae bacterium]
MSAKPVRSLLWLKVLVAIAVIVVAAVVVPRYLRPVAKVETVISGDAIDAEPGSLTVKEKYSMQMKSSVSGRVLNKDYKLEVGMPVKEGDLLVHLDTGDVEIAIEQVQAEYDAAKQRIALGSAEKYLLETAQSDFNNVERLFKMGQVSDSEYQKAHRAVETIMQRQAQEKVRDEEDLKTDENTLKARRREMEMMTITAPFDGVVSMVNAHPGDLIGSGAPIVTLITTDRVVEAKISEENFANIKEGQNATVTFLPYGEWLYHGVVTKILPTADPETQRHLVDINVTDIAPEKLVPGITGEVTIEVGRRHAKAIIPRRAILNENVYVVKDGKVELRPVKKGFVWLTGAEVVSGLEPGEQVIVEDLDSFREGDSVGVQVLEPDAIGKRK